MESTHRDAPACSRMSAARASGWETPTGTYAAPAASTPSTAATWPGPFGSLTATRSPSPTPAAASPPAMRRARPASSP